VYGLRISKGKLSRRQFAKKDSFGCKGRVNHKFLCNYVNGVAVLPGVYDVRSLSVLLPGPIRIMNSRAGGMTEGYINYLSF